MICAHLESDEDMKYVHKLFLVWWEWPKSCNDGSFDMKHEIVYLNVKLKRDAKGMFLRMWRDGNPHPHVEAPLLFEKECAFDTRPARRTYDKMCKLQRAKIGRPGAPLKKDMRSGHWIRSDNWECVDES